MKETPIPTHFTPPHTAPSTLTPYLFHTPTPTHLPFHTHHSLHTGLSHALRRFFILFRAHQMTIEDTSAFSSADIPQPNGMSTTCCHSASSASHNKPQQHNIVLVHVCVYTCVCLCAHVFVCTCLCVHVYVFMCVHMFVCVHMFIYIFVCPCVCLCVCVYTCADVYLYMYKLCVMYMYV